MMASLFCKWIKWNRRRDIPGKEYPGVYAISISKSDISGEPFTMRKEIVYFGMTHSRHGIASRLQQFQNTIRGGTGHGGADRFRHKHTSYNALSPRLYVSASYTKCDPATKKSSDLRAMGRIAKQEYDCIAEYVDRFCRLPEFNDMVRSPKK